MSTPPENFDLWKILAETKLIIKSHARQYQILSLLFLLPTAFTIIIYPFILQETFFNQHQPLISHAPALVNLLYILAVSILSISGTAPITYTTIHALCHTHTPVEKNLISSVKSILPSFLPLLSTLVIQELMFGSCSWPFVEDLVQIYVKHEEILNLSTIFLRLVLFIASIILQANWTLSFVLAVCEPNDSKGGLKPLKRSTELVKGKNWVALSVVLLFDLMYATFFAGFYSLSERRSWGFLFYMIISLVYMTMNLLLNMVSNVVLYFYCLELHGEVPLPYSSLEEAVPLPK